MIDAMPSSMRDRLGDQEITKQILELHGFGQSLVTIDCAKIVPDVSNLHVDWDDKVQLPETRLREWEDSLRCVVAGLRYERQSTCARNAKRVCIQKPSIIQTFAMVCATLHGRV